MSQALQNAMGRISRNRLINPDSAIDQRNSGALFVPAAGTVYTTDRYFVEYSVVGKINYQQYAIALGASQPTNSSHKVVVAAQYTPLAADYFIRDQAIEGLRMRDLLWGSSFARPMMYTVCGMWPVAGVYSVAFRNSAKTRSFVSTFTVTQANTLETHSISVPGCTDSTWPVDNTSHTRITLSMGIGANFTTSTLNQWQAGNFVKAPGSIDLVSLPNGSAMYIAFEQYERDMRTEFEVVPYEEQMRQCQRYYQLVGTSARISSTLAGQYIQAGYTTAPMRATPTAKIISQQTINTQNATLSAFNAFSGRLEASSVAIGDCYIINRVDALSAEL